MAGLTARFKEWPWRTLALSEPGATAIFIDGKPVSWTCLNQAILDAHHWLEGQSLSKGNILALVSANNYNTLVLMLASWQAGLRTLLVNPSFSAEDVDSLCRRIGVDCVFSPLPHYSSRPQTNQPDLPVALAPFNIQQLMTLTLTSGSSGEPKAVAHTAMNHLASAEGLLSLMPFTKTDAWLLSLPMFHVSGLAIIWRWLYQGATLVVTETGGDALISAAAMCSHASLVPTQLRRLLEANRPYSLHSVLLGGAAIPQDLVDGAEARGIRCWCGYGMTEMASTITAKRADSRYAVGTPLPYRQLEIADDGEVLVGGRPFHQELFKPVNCRL